MQIGIGLGIPATHGNIAGFTPLELSPALWLDASDTSTITEVSGAVSQWDDKSGNGNNATQATAAAQPTTGSTTLNGLNVISNDGNDHMVIPSVAFSGLTMFRVYRHSSETGMMLGAADPTKFAGVFQTGSGTAPDQNFGTVSYHVDGVLQTSVTRGTLWTAVNGQTQIHRVTTTLTSTVALAILGYPGSASFTAVGDLAEVIIVDGTLTASEIAATESYLADKWGITL